MKCKYCGAAVTLEDEFCPYCGALNEPARKHIEDMKRYGEDFEETKTEVLENAAKQSTKHARIIVIVVLVLVNVILIAMQFNSYEIADYFTQMKVHSHADEYKETLLSYEADEDYAMLYQFYMTKDCWYEDSLKEFDSVAYMANAYARIYGEIYSLESDVYNYHTKSESLQYIASHIENFYSYYIDLDSGYRPEMYEGTHLTAMQDMDEKLGAILKTYMNLTDEDVAGLSEMDEADILILLGRRTGYYD